MERNRQRLTRGTGVKSWVTQGCGRGLLFACGGLYFVVTLFGAVNWSLWGRTAVHWDQVETAKLFAVVVPAHAGDIGEAVVALSNWPSVCSAVTLHRMQLVLYYSGTAEDGVWSDETVTTVAKTGGRCFQRTRVVFADLDDKVIPCAASYL